MPTTSSLWTSSRYRRWLTADTGTGLGDAMTGFVVPLITLTATDDPAAAGLVSACGLTARIAATLPGGSAADRHDRVRLMGLGGVLGVLGALALLVLVGSNVLGTASLVLINVCLGLLGGFFAPASDAALKGAVPAARLGRAQAANQGRDATVSLAAAPLGGLLLGLGAWVACLGIAAARAATAVASWALSRTPQLVTTAAEVPDAVVPHYRDTLGWLWRRHDLRWALVAATVVNLAWGICLTTVIYSQQQRGTDPATIGLLSTAMGVGMLIGSLAAGRLVRRVPTGILTACSLALMTAGAGLLTLVTEPAPVALLLGVSVIGSPVLNAGVLGYITVITPSAKIGKVSAIVGFGAMLAMPLGPLVAGLGLAGPGRTVVLGVAAGLCGLSTLIALASPGVRRIPVEGRWQEHGAPGLESDYARDHLRD